MVSPAVPEPNIIYEDKDIIVLNKPAGLMVHGVERAKRELQSAKRNGNSAKRLALSAVPETTLVDWLLARYPEITTVGDPSMDSGQVSPLRPGIVHRLDKDTSGVMVVARNQASFDYLKSLFQNHEIKKTYLAVVRGTPKKESGIIDAPIGIVTGSTRRSIRSKKMAKEAVTEYRVLGSRHSGLATREEKPDTRYPIPEAYSLLEIHPRTGRTHQIRVHLASIGHPIVGDKLYGNRKLSGYRVSPLGSRHSGRKTRYPIPDTRLMLHALSLEFTNRDGKRMKFEAEPPEGFAREATRDKRQETGDTEPGIMHGKSGKLKEF